MSITNQYGLTRYIPKPTKRKIRQRCGFGCVICGNAIVQYEHIDPTFADARSHSPDGITLLCPSHHAEVTSGLRSKGSVVEASANPKCLATGFSSFIFEPIKNFPNIIFGSNAYRRTSLPFVVNGHALFLISAPQKQGDPFLISAEFMNAKGEVSAQIYQNEWIAHSGKWDVEMVGPRLTIRESEGNISLQLCFTPGEGIIVERLKMFVKGAYVEIDSEGALKITQDGGAFISYGNEFTAGNPNVKGFVFGKMN